MGPGEGPPFVPEELALEQRGVDRPAVHRHEGPVAAGTVVVDRPGDDVLPAAAFAQDEDGAVLAADPVDQLVASLHHRRDAHERPRPVALLELLAEPLVLGLEVAHAPEALQDERDLFELERLGQEIRRAELHGLDGRFDGPVGRHHHDLKRGALPLELLEELEASQARHPEVKEGHVERPRAQEREGLLRARHVLELHLLPRGHDVPEDPPDRGIVIHHQEG